LGRAIHPNLNHILKHLQRAVGGGFWAGGSHQDLGATAALKVATFFLCESAIIQAQKSEMTEQTTNLVSRLTVKWAAVGKLYALDRA